MFDNFKFYNPTKIYFGKDTLKKLEGEIEDAKHILIVYEGDIIKKIGIYDQVIKILKDFNKKFTEYPGMLPNPQEQFCVEGAIIAKDKNVDLIIGIGGGSVIDGSKAIAALTKNPNHSLFEYINGQKSPINKPVKLGVILTSAATSSENSPAAVITETTTGKKGTFFWEENFPSFAICDPTFTYSLPKKQTAIGAFDAFSHVVEQYMSIDGLEAAYLPHLHIIESIIKYVPIALRDPTNYVARANIMWSATQALNGHGYVSKKPGWYAHGLSYPLTSKYNIPHGAALAIILPTLIKFQLEKGENIELFTEKIKEISMVAFGHDNVNDFIEDLKTMITSWGIPLSVYEWGVKKPSDETIFALAANGFLGHSNESFLKTTKKVAAQIYKEIFSEE